MSEILDALVKSRLEFLAQSVELGGFVRLKKSFQQEIDRIIHEHERPLGWKHCSSSNGKVLSG